jgi:GNAT superfamily N-acetyltransferase
MSDDALDLRFTARAATAADIPAATELLNVCARAVLGHDTMDVTFMENDWASPFCRPETDIRLVFEGRRLVGYAGAWIEPPAVVVYGEVHVHPDYQGQGIGPYLVKWLKGLVRDRAIPLAPDGAKVVLHHEDVPRADAYRREVLLSSGHRVVRHGFRMLIELDTAPPAPVLPEGIVMRAFVRERHLPDLVRTEQQIFKDHWGYVHNDFDQSLAAWKHWIDNDPHHNPDLWFLAVERETLLQNGEDVIAGVCLCTDFMPEDPDMTYVESLGVQRPWRRQGLGLAMLHHAFGVFHRRGKKRVTLDVDAESLTGATRLYEKAGMHVQREDVTYEFVVREGRDLSTQVLRD